MKRLSSVIVTSLIAASIVTAISCSSGDSNSSVEESTAQESIFKHVADTCIINSITYIKTNKLRTLLLTNKSNALQHPTACIEVYATIKDDPGMGEWSGRYDLTAVEGTATVGTSKVSLAATTDGGKVKGGNINFEYQGKTSDGLKLYTVTLHVDEMTEQGGNYARNISLTGTDYIGTMLTY